MIAAVIMVDVRDNQTEAMNVEGFTLFRPKNPEHLSAVFHPGDVTVTAQWMAKRFPGQDILVFEVREAFYSKASPIVKKILDKTTGELILA